MSNLQRLPTSYFRGSVETFGKGPLGWLLRYF